MKNSFLYQTRYCFILLVVFYVLSAFPGLALGTDPPETLRRMYVIGDSTAAAYGPERFPLTGWAQVLQRYFDPNQLQVVDKAVSGRSSKSYWEEGRWDEVKGTLKKGDYVVVQFGHNDAKQKDPKRFTDPETTYKQYLNRYVDDIQAAGAIPILATSINRNVWKEDGTLEHTLGEYPVVVRALARERSVFLVDMTRLTRMLFEKLGPEKTTKLFMNLEPGQYEHYPEGRSDNTHLTMQGAESISKVFIDDLVSLDKDIQEMTAAEDNLPQEKAGGQVRYGKDGGEKAAVRIGETGSRK
jgi:lysophospholipase L1-like esterase